MIMVTYAFIDYNSRAVKAMGILSFKTFPTNKEVDEWLREAFPESYETYSRAWAVMTQ